MSKERARRRAEREREAAIRRAARASEQERRERSAARRAALRRTRGRFGLPGRRGKVGRPSGTVARRRRRQHQVTLLILLALVVLAFVVRPDWPARLAAVVVAVLAYPVLRTLLFRRA